MRNLKRAFGSPDDAFHGRVRETLFRIEEKEEEPVKKKLTLSMALAFALCLCITMTAALAASGMLSSVQPDATQTPLSHSENTASPDKNNPSIDPNGLVWLQTTENLVYHLDSGCAEIESADLTEMTLANAVDLGADPCPICCSLFCYADMDDPAVYHLFPECPAMHSYTGAALGEAALSGRLLCSDCAVIMLDAAGEPALIASWPELTQADPLSTPSPVPLQSTPEADSLNATVTPMPTPQPAQTTEPLLVWSGENEEYYHAAQDCSASDTLQRVVLAVALNRSQSACPLCMDVAPTPTPMPESEDWMYADLCLPVVYTAEDDMLYHSISPCAGADGKELTSVQPDIAFTAGRSACPDCIHVFQDPDDPVIHHMYAGCPVAGDETIRFRGMYRYTPDMVLCSECTVWTSPHGVFYHRDADCSGSRNLSPCSRRYAGLLGKSPCPTCLPDEQGEANAVPAEAAERPAEWTELDVSRFDTCPELTLHTAATLRTRGCLYAEFEFTLNDESLHPDSVRIVLTDGEENALDVLTALATETTNADGATVNLLCETMPLPDDSFTVDALTIYAGSDPDTHELPADPN